MDREVKQKGDAGNTPQPDREKNQGTGVTRQPPEKKNPFDMEDNAKAE